MSRNYYEDLEIKRCSSQNQIAAAYRKLSLRWHPDTCQEDPNTANYYFNIISEAYEVLSDPIKKAFFDKYGEEKLKDGMFSEGQLKGGYRYKNNAQEVFDKFFGEQDAFQQIFNEGSEEKEGTMFGTGFGNQNFKGTQPPKDLVVRVDCTLNEIYNGCYKEVSFLRQVMNNDGRTTKVIQETKTICIKRGIKDKARIVIAGQGHEDLGFKPSNLIYEINQLKHDEYKRKGDDLVKQVKITLVQALKCSPIKFQSFDGRNLQISIDQIIGPNTIKQVKGEGMYCSDQDDKKGDMFIKFDIVFPKQIEQEKLEEVLSLLQ